MIELPQKFKTDTEGNDTYLIPLVVIDNRIYLSTSKVSLQQKNYDPLIKSISNIKESIDVTNKIFKISYFQLSLINYKYNNNRISDEIFSGISIMNKKIDIYYKSQSAQSLDDCLKVYSGYVRKISESSELLKIECEDSTEYSMNQALPAQTIPFDAHVPDKYWGERVPIIYGHVSKAPCVYFESLTGENSESPYAGSDTYKIIPDDKDILETSKPMIYASGAYGEIKETADMFGYFRWGTIYQNVSTETQYQIVDGKIFIQKYVDPSSGEYIGVGSAFDEDIDNPTLTQLGFVEVITESRLSYTSGNYILITSPAETIGTEAGVATTDGEPNPYYSGGLLIQRTKVHAYEDEEGNIPSENKTVGDRPLYLMIKDYKDLVIPDKWLQGENEFLGTSYPYVNQADDNSWVHAWSYLYFETEKWFSSSNILMELPTIDETTGDEGDPDRLPARCLIRHNIDAHINELSAEIHEARYPYVYFRHGDGRLAGNSEFWDMGDNNPNKYLAWGADGILPEINPYTISSLAASGGTTQFIDMKTPSSTRIYLRCNSDWNTAHELKWLKLNDMTVIRQGVIKDFLELDIFAEVKGRVDDVSGRYTGQEQIALSAQSDFDARVETDMEAPQLSKAKKSKGKKSIRKKSIRSSGGGY